jgi:hypothetical protein
MENVLNTKWKEKRFCRDGLHRFNCDALNSVLLKYFTPTLPPTLKKLCLIVKNGAWNGE